MLSFFISLPSPERSLHNKPDLSRDVPVYQALIPSGKVSPASVVFTNKLVTLSSPEPSS